MEHLDCVIIGAGVVGLAVARELAVRGRRVLVFEAEAKQGQHASSHNSGVIHAGVYYPTGSLKARLCVSGRRSLYRYLAERDVPHRRVGKLMLAVEEGERPALERIARLGAANGVGDLIALSADDIRALEPEAAGVAGVLSPSTGIVQTQALMQALRADLEAAGGTVVFSTPVTGGRVTDGAIELEAGGNVRCRSLINAAGHHAPRVARLIEGPHRPHAPRPYFAMGHYFALRGPSPFRRLVYPMPSPEAPHVHLSLDLEGRARVGPDVTWADAPSYAFDETRAPAFYRALRRYFPALQPGDLTPDRVGIRARIVGPGDPPADFIVQDRATHGVPGLIHLFGIESPGLTACLALAHEVATRLVAE